MRPQGGCPPDNIKAARHQQDVISPAPAIHHDHGSNYGHMDGLPVPGRLVTVYADCHMELGWG